MNLVVPLRFLNVGGYTKRMWMEFEGFVILLSVYIIFVEKLPEKGKIILSIVLGGLVGITSPMSGICTSISFIAASRIFEKYNNEIKVWKESNLKQVIITIVIGIITGTGLGFINLFLGSNQLANFSIKPIYFLVSLNPGIFEEISFRLFMYAFCIYLLDGVLESRKEKLWCYVLMILPHVLIHLPDLFYDNGVLSINLVLFLVNTLVLSSLFGLPFAIMQRKRDLMSSMISHGIVNFIKFCFYGLPVG